MYNSLLVAIDGSEEGTKALDLACRLAREDDAQLHLLHVPEALHYPTTLVWGIGAVPIHENTEELDVAAQKLIKRAESEARDYGVMQVQTHLVKGDPARTILSQAELLKVDTIVIGSRVLGNLSGLMMGSVSHKITNSAKCGVVVVR